MATTNITVEGYAASAKSVKALVTQIQPETSVGVAAVDAATTQALVNELRLILIATGQAS